ncbi:TPA: ead/Ea22-like family protein [Enterobacter hormaechei subsp. xiangfangensis]|nr:ead/Ea22-like family protein [Enterobacter hormaechei subsp. xiangfangensis]
MSNIDKRALREAAEKASTDNHTQDEWFHYLRCSTPETVLALLDELEKMQAQSSKWCEAFHKAVSVGARYEERIAELERNEIREEGNQFLVVRHTGKLPVVKHCAGELEGFLRQLLEHDPMATIDIVTHRYYGVGGQWVQDADEYLQMMAAAAGKGEAS